MNYNIKGFMKYPEIEIYNLKNEKWISEDIGDNNSPILKYGNNKVDWSNIDGIRSDVTEINFEVYEKKDIEEYKEFNQSYINKSEEQNQEIEFDKNEEDNENIEYVEDTILMDESEEIDLKQIEDEINLNNINKDDDIGKKDTLYIKNIKGGKIQYKISAEKFREQDKNYNEYDTIKMCYTKMQNIKLDSKLKFIERYEKRRSELKGTIPNNNHLYPNNINSLDNDKIPVSQIIEDSKFIAAKIYSIAQIVNLNQEIPFKNTEVNILIDVSRTIGDNDKLFNMLLLCGISLGFNSLKIPYAITLIGDGEFNIIIKQVSELYNPIILQKVLDCIFIKRCNTELASSLKIAQKNIKNKNEINNLFIILTNGIDEELRIN